MKHVTTILLLAALGVASAGSQSISLEDALAEMHVTLHLPPDIETVQVIDGADPEYQVAYRFPGERYEVRVSLFPQSWLFKESGGGNVDRYVPLFSMGVLAAMAREAMTFCKTAELPGPTVKMEFGADSGLSTLAKGDRSDFGRGFKQIAVVFLYRSGSGVAMITFLFDEPKDLKMDGLQFSQAYYCLRFNDPVP